jgi:hypothetical protein
VRSLPPFNHGFVNWLAQVAAHHRLSSGHTFGDATYSLQQAQAGTLVPYVETVPYEFIWNLPDASDEEVRHIYQRDHVRVAQTKIQQATHNHA